MAIWLNLGSVVLILDVWRQLALIGFPTPGSTTTPGPTQSPPLPPPAVRPSAPGDINVILPDHSAWGDLWPLLLTAALTLLATLFVQYAVVPRVEGRKRREDRWERDVLALGELLTFEKPRALNQLRGELRWQVTFNFPPKGARPERVEELRKEHAEPLRVAEDMYAEINSRSDWMADRIIALDKKAEGLRLFHWRWLKYWVDASHLATIHKYRSDKKGPLTEGELGAALKAESKSSRELVEALTTLADNPPPRSTPRSSLRRAAAGTKRKAKAIWRRIAA